MTQDNDTKARCSCGLAIPVDREGGKCVACALDTELEQCPSCNRLAALTATTADGRACCVPCVECEATCKVCDGTGDAEADGTQCGECAGTGIAALPEVAELADRAVAKRDAALVLLSRPGFDVDEVAALCPELAELAELGKLEGLLEEMVEAGLLERL